MSLLRYLFAAVTAGSLAASCTAKNIGGSLGDESGVAGAGGSSGNGSGGMGGEGPDGGVGGDMPDAPPAPVDCTTAADGAVCDDGNPCTAGEACAAGQCIAGMPANDGMMCDDGNGCTSGTTCQNGVCTGATSEITMCLDNDSCCPVGCVADNNCTYWASGVQKNVPIETLVGWTKCFEDDYTDEGTSTAAILAECDKPKLLMACKHSGTTNLELVAMAPRADVFVECPAADGTCTQSNGVGWYYSGNWSGGWGFAPGGLSVLRASCDYNGGNQVSPELRLCWMTQSGELKPGWRCGNSTPHVPGVRRLVFEAD